MSILQQQLVTTGLADSPTQIIFLSTSDTLATVTTAGYLSKYLGNQTTQLGTNQLAVVETTDAGTVMLQVTVSAGIWSLANNAVADVVATPTTANQICYATNTGGSLAASGLSTALFNAGNISAGISGTAGEFHSYSSTASRGYLALKAIANLAAYNVTISNAAFGQTSVLSFADVGAATGNFLVTGVSLVSGNFPVNSGTAGLIVDSGIVAANVMVNTAVNTMAAASQIILDKGTGTESSHAVTINKQSGVITTTSLTTAGGATETITLTNSEVAANSVVLASIGNGTNTATNAYSVSVTVTLHTVVFVITNLTAATALNGTLVVNFAVF